MQLFLIVLGAFVGGFVSGLTGFGTGLTALGIWLQVGSPALASPLVVICSVAVLIEHASCTMMDRGAARWHAAAHGVLEVLLESVGP